MLIHIRPRLFCPFKEVSLVDLNIEPLGLRLSGARHLSAGRPYRNKHYSVAYRRGSRKAIDGILLSAPGLVKYLGYSARWAIAAEIVVTHKVRYVVLDQDFDAASDDMTVWGKHSRQPGVSSLGDWENRDPAWARADGVFPCNAEPAMEVLPRTDVRYLATTDVMEGNYISERRQEFHIPTIEKERMLGTWLNTRMPDIASAFKV